MEATVVQRPGKVRAKPAHRLNVLCLALMFLVGTTAFAELPVARLLALTPMGGRVGTELEVTIDGTDLDDAGALHFSSPGITAKPKVSSGKPEANHFIVMISSNAPIGRVEARVSGRFGISNPRSFVVSDLTEVTEKEPDNTPETAQKISLNSAINGQTDAAGEDYFRFPAEKDQRVLIEAAGSSIDSKGLPVMVLFDPSGAEVARARSGGLIDFTAASSGEHVLQVHDLTYQGGRDFFYRVRLGTFPRIDYVTPGVGKPGAKSTQHIFGRNLPDGKPSDQKGSDGKPLEEIVADVQFPASAESFRLDTGVILKPSAATVDGVDFSVKNPSGSSDPYLISFSNDPAAGQIASETHELKEIPCEYGGRFHPGKNESIIFSAKKGEQYWIEIASERLGYPADPFMVLQRVTKNDKGEIQYSDVAEMYDKDENLGGNEFKTSTRDLWYHLKATEEGQYRVLIRDLFNEAKTKRGHPYLLSIRRDAPDFRLEAIVEAPPNPNKDGKNVPIWASFLRKGDHIPLRLLAFRKDDFKGDISLSMEGLPSGVTFSPAMIRGDQNVATIILTSSKDASPFAGPVRIMGSASISNGTVTREARAASLIWPVEDYSREALLSRITRDFTLAVAEKELAPIALEPIEEKTWETSVANKLDIPLKIVRRGDFNGSLKFKVLSEPPKEFEVDGKATNATVQIDLNQAKYGVGEHDVIVLAQTSGKYRRLVPEEIKALEEQVKSANEQISAADKQIGTLTEQQKSADEKRKGELAAQIKEQQGKKDSLTAQIKTWNQQMQPADTTCTVYGPPLHIKITAAPIQFASAVSGMSLKRGGKAEVAIQMKRLYGYKDPIEVSIVLPNELKGISVAKVTIPADQTEAKLLLESSTNATMGEKKVSLVAIAKLNNKELKIEQPLGISVTEQ